MKKRNNTLLLQKLREKIDSSKLKKIRIYWEGKERKMEGIVLNKKEWEEYKRVTPISAAFVYGNCLWFRGYPIISKSMFLKQVLNQFKIKK